MPKYHQISFRGKIYFVEYKSIVVISTDFIIYFTKWGYCLIDKMFGRNKELKKRFIIKT